MKNLKNVFLFLVAGFAFMFNSVAHAVPVDLTSLTAAVDFSTTTAAILLVAAAMAGVYIAWKAAKLVISALRGL